MSIKFTNAAADRLRAIKAALDSINATFDEVSKFGDALDLLANCEPGGSCESKSLSAAVQEHIDWDTEDPFGTAENKWHAVIDLLGCAS